MSVASRPKKSFPALMAAALLTGSAAHGQYTWSADFNNQLTPEGMILRGNAQLQMNTGVSGTACLALTPSSSGMQGDVALPRIWAADETPAEVRVRFSLKLSGNSGGVPGDGFSVSVSNGIPEVLGDEEGFAPGPYYSFDTFENSPGDAGLDIKWPYQGNLGYEANALKFFPDRSAWYGVDIRSMLYAKDQDIRVNGATIAGPRHPDSGPGIQYTDARIMLAARTGDAFNAHLIDNLSVDVTPYPIFRQQPQSQKATTGTSVIFEAPTNFNTLPFRGLSTFTLVNSVTSEWQVKHPGGQWTAVPDTTLPLEWGQNSRPFVIFRNLNEDQGLWDGEDPALMLNGTEVRCVLRWHNGYTVATNPAMLEIMRLPSEYLNHRALWNAYPQGSASVTFPNEEGKVLRLTPAQPDCLGGFVFDELSHNNTGQPNLLEMAVGSFQYRGSNPSEIRADGFSFNIASDLPDTFPAGAGEEGAGSGLRICFDAYANGPDDPAAIDIIWKGQLLIRIPVDPDGLFNEDWVNVYFRLNYGGTLDLALNGTAIVSSLPLPRWAGIPTPRLAFYGRTGSYWQQQDVRELDVWPFMGPYLPFDPQLSIRASGPDTYILEWIVSPTETWNLYESTDLIRWTLNTQTPVATGQARQLFLSKDAPRRFYRMEKVPD